MIRITRTKIVITFAIVLVLTSTAAVTVGASPIGPGHQARQLSQGPQTMSGGPIAVLRRDPTVSHFRVAPPPQFSQLGIQSATISVAYLPGGTYNVAGTYCYDWPNDAKIAFSYATSIWASLINSSVPIKINACWAELDPGILGYGGPLTFHKGFSGGQPNTWYPAAAANAFAGSDLNNSDGFDNDADGNDADADMIVAYSRIYDWYYGTDGNTPSGELDFASVVLHEICHGLGFAGSMRVSGGLGYYGGLESGDLDPIAYDRFTENGSGTALLSYSSGSSALATQLTSNNVYFDGTNANAANGGSRPKLFAPSTWMQGSSYSHLDEIFNGTDNALMTYALADGESNHSPGPVAFGILQDVGWAMSATGPTVTSITPNSGNYTETVHITNLAGTNFRSGATVKLTKSGESDIDATGVNVESATRISCDFDLNGAAAGKWNVVVTNTDAQSGTLYNGFTVSAPGDKYVYLPVAVRDYPPIETIQLFPSADATVLQGQPSNNWGGLTTMRVGYDYSGCPDSVDGKIARSMLRFDLSSIPTGASVVDAKLHLDFVTSCYFLGHSQRRTVTIYRAASSWSESAVTWNNKPSYAEAYGSASVGVTSSTLGWYSFDVTNLVRAWMAGTYSNNGVVVRSPETSGSDFVRLEIAAREASGTSFDPYLEVTYIEPAMSMQEATTAEQALAPDSGISSYRSVLGLGPSLSECEECVQGRTHSLD